MKTKKIDISKIRKTLQARGEKQESLHRKRRSDRYDKYGDTEIEETYEAGEERVTPLHLDYEDNDLEGDEFDDGNNASLENIDSIVANEGSDNNNNNNNNNKVSKGRIPTGNTYKKAIVAVAKNSYFRPFTADESHLVHALKNYYTDLAKQYLPVFASCVEMLSERLEDCDFMLAQIRNCDTSRKLAKLMQKHSRLFIPSTVSFSKLVNEWYFAQRNILAVIIYRSKLVSTVHEVTVPAIDWTSEKASSTGHSAVEIIKRIFSQILKTIVAAQKSVNDMASVIDDIYDKQPHTFRIHINTTENN